MSRHDMGASIVVGNTTSEVVYNPAWPVTERDARFGRIMSAGEMYFNRVARPLLSQMTPEGALRQVVSETPAVRAAIEGAINSSTDFAALATEDYNAGRYAEAFRKASVYLRNAVELDRILTNAVPRTVAVWQGIPYRVANSMIADAFNLAMNPPRLPSFPWFKVGLFGAGAFGIYWLMRNRDAD